jgi:2-polyprenyl-3-methyl-5-hydroxy-6-metoxy-1,4-benzoquinol methylase
MDNIKNNECCIFCGEKEHTTLYKFADLPEYKQVGEARDIVECSGCSLVYCYPRNPEESMLDIYENNYWQDYQTQVGEKEIKDRILDFELISKERMDYIQPFKTTGKFLDVGCCMGFLTNEADKRGYDAYGIDLNAEDINNGRERYNIKLEKGFLENFHQYDFDIITSFNVLEHVSDPIKMLLEKKKRLKRDGIIVVGTHDIECKNHQKEKQNWKHIIPNDHLYFFSLSTLKKFGEKVGLELIYYNKPIENGMVAYFTLNKK